MSVGLVGLPNVGKSTIFNALCAGGAKVSNYAFCTIEPNRAVVSVPDERLETIGRVFDQERLVPAAIEFVDIAGLVRGANQGEGLGNQFLAAIREAEALLHIVRCFEEPDIAHVEGTIDPLRDIEIVNTELLLADLVAIQRRREKIAADIKGRDNEALRETAALDELEAHLGEGQPARTIPRHDDLMAGTQVFLLTDKPQVYVANTGEDATMAAPYVQSLSAHLSDPVIAVSGKLEADLSEMDDEERAAFIEELELISSGLERTIQACYRALDLITFFTGVGAEARAWALPLGTTAGEAAGKIHTDMERGFIRAEVVPWERLAALGSWQEAHKAGEIRSEGRDYEVREGDVLQIRFSR
ncbi:MAG: redox-regulated ATPase YchF [Armatimonadetes bacterium]|nr:redox-regulated ATPase YchF [Armatimonadota bacterium]